MTFHFRNAGFDVLRTSSNNQREECERIWENVRSKLYGLTESGHVDESIRGALYDRDHEFRTRATRFEETVQNNDNVMRNVQNIGIDGGQQMVKSLTRGLYS